jgi:hypothetical protein
MAGSAEVSARENPAMTFDEWWEEHWFEISPEGGPAGVANLEQVWDAAQEQVLPPRVAAGPEADKRDRSSESVGNYAITSP